MKKNLLTGIVWIIAVTVVVGLIAGFVTFRSTSKVANGNNGGKELKPIEMITGIYTPASLKPGCYVKNGSSIPSSDDGIWCHCGVTSAVVNVIGTETDKDNKQQEGLPIKSLSIVDVYNGNCTIIFTVEGLDHLYVDYDYPLDNLNYDPIKVARADDGIKTQLYGSGFTLLESANNYRINLIIKVIIISAVLSVGILLILRKRRKKNQGAAL
ncbi:MAG: hypothetical protein K6F45_02440 [Saccharofermentans sp.]|nr:hypothetical protein [Saccharofermentans sp.]